MMPIINLCSCLICAFQKSHISIVIYFPSRYFSRSFILPPPFPEPFQKLPTLFLLLMYLVYAAHLLDSLRIRERSMNFRYAGGCGFPRFPYRPRWPGEYSPAWIGHARWCRWAGADILPKRAWAWRRKSSPHPKTRTQMCIRDSSCICGAVSASKPRYPWMSR